MKWRELLLFWCWFLRSIYWRYNSHDDVMSGTDGWKKFLFFRYIYGVTSHASVYLSRYRPTPNFFGIEASESRRHISLFFSETGCKERKILFLQ